MYFLGIGFLNNRTLTNYLWRDNRQKIKRWLVIIRREDGKVNIFSLHKKIRDQIIYALILCYSHLYYNSFNKITYKIADEFTGTCIFSSIT